MVKFFGTIVVFGVLCAASCLANPKYESAGNSVYSDNWRRSYKENDTASAATADRTERLGFTTGYGSGGGYPSYPNTGSGLSSYNPVKLDLGGVVVGTLIGIGAILIIPKLIGVFTGSYGGGHYRSVDGADSNGLAEMMTKLETILSQNNIDSTTCVQRAVCHYVRSSEYHTSVGTADQAEQVIHTIASNSIVDYMLDGTAVKEALENGKKVDGKDCDQLYSACPLDRERAMQILTKFIPKNTTN